MMETCSSNWQNIKFSQGNSTAYNKNCKYSYCVDNITHGRTGIFSLNYNYYSYIAKSPNLIFLFN